jgi:hypothetical protein
MLDRDTVIEVLRRTGDKAREEAKIHSTYIVFI